MKKIIRLFIVDDHQLIIDGIKARLADTGNLKIIGVAGNGKEALEKLQKVSVDVLLMDIVMPVMNGFDATRAILAKFPHIKIIALTSYDEKSVVNKMLESGASGYILKNVKKDELIKAIETVHSGQRYFSSEIPAVIAKPVVEEKYLRPALQQLPNPLSTRELEVLRLIALGFSNNEIAKKLFISAKTVDTHRTRLMQKLDVHSIADLVRFAIQNKLID